MKTQLFTTISTNNKQLTAQTMAEESNTSIWHALGLEGEAQPHPLAGTFKLWSGATVLLPLIIHTTARLAMASNNNYNDEEDENDGNNYYGRCGQGYYYDYGYGGCRRFSGRGQAHMIFAYIWSLLVFFLMVSFGNRILAKAGRPLQPLLSSLLIFANISLLCTVLMSVPTVSIDRGQ